MLLNPKIDKFEHLDNDSRETIKKLILYFENKGLETIKKEDHEREWYSDFLEFVKKEEIFYNFLTPTGQGEESSRWDTFRNCQLNEVLGFYGLCYWYTWQVSILGLGPIWMSSNKDIQKQSAKFLKDGGIFAYGLSEKEHGADIYSTQMTLTPKGDGTYFANGEKYYIGNANQAAFVSTFGKMSDTGDFVFFVVDSKHEKFECIQNVTNSQNYVAEFRLNDYPITDTEILSVGREAWDMSLNTVNIGKFNLGWASIGICTHAFYEALDHASGRYLFDHYVTEFTHIKHLFVDSYTRLVAMKLFALRGSDYMRAASPDDRRYLLYNPMVKMKVTTQGEEVINLLWDVIAAKGFEKSMYFEMAARDIRALPKLEGTVHVNMALIIKFMKNYFFNPAEFPEISKMDGGQNDDFMFKQGPTKGLGKIQFHDYKKIYNSVNLPNVNLFKKQIRLLKLLLAVARPNKNQIKDFDFLLNLGELFTLVVYGQLILENAKILGIEDDLIDQIFDFIIRDFSKYSLILYSKTSSTAMQKYICKKIIRKPVVNPDRINKILEDYVYLLKDTYKMNQ
ncbi:MAG: acyl-CoA dehydrogenase [Candidatus Marinimicrobia bacterium]|nr:acyl-CoA dehydrogenase [Candidatus Neomarinimicrobiota bacterium]